MARKAVINVKCPCCKRILEVDVEKERVVAHREGSHLKEDAKDGEDMLDVALRQTKESRDRAEDRFRDAKERLSNQEDRLEKLFEDAQRKAKEEGPDEAEPGNPFSGGKIWD